MFTAFIQLLSGFAANFPGGRNFDDDKTQIWIIGSRDQVAHTMNEFCVRRIAPDRAKFTPIFPAWFAPGKFMTILKR